MAAFKFSLGQQARIAISGETGEITGRAEYSTTENTYFLRYKSADGRAVTQWWEESALAESEPACEYCHGSGECRQPYSLERGPCPHCSAASRPSSDTSASTVGTVGKSSK